MLEVLLDALKDSFLAFIIILLFNILISFIEGKLASKVNKNNKLSPLLGSLIGLIPQCGFSIVATNLYTKSHITMGTLIAVYIACSDEALPLMLSEPSKIYMVLPLLLIKLVIGFTFGYLIDVIFHKHRCISQIKIKMEEENDEEENEIHKGCCHHDIEENTKSGKSNIKKHFIHPLIHSIKVIIYVFIVNLFFGTLIYLIGEENFSSFLNSQKWLTPLYSSIIGLIPNCASSVLITELYIQNSISFGATVSGLCCNAGLGFMFLFKDNKDLKNNLLILASLIAISLFSGYLILICETLLSLL